MSIRTLRSPLVSCRLSTLPTSPGQAASGECKCRGSLSLVGVGGAGAALYFMTREGTTYETTYEEEEFLEEEDEEEYDEEYDEEYE